MAFSLNRSQLIGNVTRDPELRTTSGGQTVCSFSVATNRSWTDNAGQRQEKADFHNIVAWGKLAEIVGQYVKKGRKIYVEGRSQTRDWEGEDGQKRYRTEVVAENVILLDRSGAPEDGGSYGGSFERETNSAAVRGDSQEEVSEKAPAAKAAKEEEASIDDLPV